MNAFGRKRKRNEDREPPGLFFMREFLDDLENGKIPQEAKNLMSVAFLAKALKAIVHDKIAPAEAFCLVPSSMLGFYTRPDAIETASQYRVIAEVFPVWGFFRDRFVPFAVSVSIESRLANLAAVSATELSPLSNGKSGSRKKIVAAAAVKFFKSERVIDRYFSAYRVHYAEHVRLCHEQDRLEKSAKLRKNAKWRRDNERAVGEVAQLLNQIANTVFGRSKKFTPKRGARVGAESSSPD